MALKNLNSDFQLLFSQLFKPDGGSGSGSEDPFRDTLKRFNHRFDINEEQIARELQGIKSSKSRTKKAGGKERQDLLEPLQTPEGKQLIAQVAKIIFTKFSQLPTTRSKKIDRFVVSGIKSKSIELHYHINTDQTAVVYEKVRAVKSLIIKEVFQTTQGKKFLKILDDGLAATGDGLYAVGHNMPVKEMTGAAFVRGAESIQADSNYGDEGGDQGYARIVKSKIATKIKDDLAKFDLNFEVIDEAFIFKNGQLTQRPNSTFTVYTDLETGFKNSVENQQGDSEKKEQARELGQALGNLKKYIQDTLKEEVQKARAAGWTNREGSDSFVEALGRGLVMSKSLLPLYKSGKAKNLTKWKGKGKNRYNKSKPFKHTYNTHRIKHSPDVVGSMKGVKGAPRIKAESGVDNMQIAASVLRSFVNTSLTKQVQGNMGRPGLENVTGRFAQSVNVVNANALGNHVHMDYTYQTDPYRVFENGNQYPSGYDPIPLIEKSIRELAAAKLETKFTLRRV